MAYIADNFNGKIYKVDISNIDRANSLTVVDIIADNSVSPNKFVRIESMVMEGDLDYIVAIDSEQQTLYLIDPVTGEMTLVLKTLKVKTNANASVCDQ